MDSEERERAVLSSGEGLVNSRTMMYAGGALSAAAVVGVAVFVAVGGATALADIPGRPLAVAPIDVPVPRPSATSTQVPAPRPGPATQTPLTVPAPAPHDISAPNAPPPTSPISPAVHAPAGSSDASASTDDVRANARDGAAAVGWDGIDAFLTEWEGLAAAGDAGPPADAVPSVDRIAADLADEPRALLFMPPPPVEITVDESVPGESMIGESVPDTPVDMAGLESVPPPPQPGDGSEGEQSSDVLVGD